MNENKRVYPRSSASIPPRVVAVIQARLSSSRLPLKALLHFRSKPLIDWVVDRVAQSSLLNAVVVAIPDTAMDAVLAEHLSKRKTPFFKGSEDDVLRRILYAAEQTRAELVVRVCADNPLVCGGAIDELINFYLANECDYAWNHIPRNNLWPDGLGAEIVSLNLLQQLNKAAQFPSQREHCFNYIWDNLPKFKVSTFDPSEPWLCRPDIKLDIDTPEDFCRLAKMPFEPDMDARQIINVCQKMA